MSPNLCRAVHDGRTGSRTRKVRRTPPGPPRPRSTTGPTPGGGPANGRCRTPEGPRWPAACRRRRVPIAGISTERTALRRPSGTKARRATGTLLSRSGRNPLSQMRPEVLVWRACVGAFRAGARVRGSRTHGDRGSGRLEPRPPPRGRGTCTAPSGRRALPRPSPAVACSDTQRAAWRATLHFGRRRSNRRASRPRQEDSTRTTAGTSSRAEVGGGPRNGDRDVANSQRDLLSRWILRYLGPVAWTPTDRARGSTTPYSKLGTELAAVSPVELARAAPSRRWPDPVSARSWSTRSCSAASPRRSTPPRARRSAADSRTVLDPSVQSGHSPELVAKTRRPGQTRPLPRSRPGFLRVRGSVVQGHTPCSRRAARYWSAHSSNLRTGNPVIGVDHTWAIVLAAGDGARLRSLTSDARGTSVPRQFCSFGRRGPMIRWPVKTAPPALGEQQGAMRALRGAGGCDVG